MIHLQRDSPTPLADQLVDQLRFLLATGRFVPGDEVPSTRQLGQQLGISFHTVRKAYQALEEEGLLTVQRGNRYAVATRPQPSLGERMERGAAVAQDAIQRLIGLGLTEDEILMVIEEQMAFLDTSAEDRKIVFAARFRELAAAGATQIQNIIQTPVAAEVVSRLDAHPDADLIVVPHPEYIAAADAVPQALVVGVSISLGEEAVAEVSRLGSSETLGLVTRFDDAVGPVLKELRSAAGFGGPALALSVDAERDQVADLVREVNLVVYTASARRRVRSMLNDTRSVQLTPVVAGGSIEAVVAAVRR